MKILFLCGSLQPGHDGVGDYTRRLAAEMISQGHEAAAIGLNDYGTDNKLEEVQSFENANISTLRIPAALPGKLRFSIAKRWIDRFEPEWISLQFVIFSFHLKGLPYGLVKYLVSIGKGRRWHIMFHELWVGMPEGASRKHIFWGWLQKKIICALIKSLAPAVIHTQSKLYLAHLTALGFNVKYLPLFSNVPVIYTSNKPPENNKQISIVVFGTIHPHAAIELILNEVTRYKRDNKADVSFTIIGHSGMETKKWVSAWVCAGMRVINLGEQPVTNISQVLSCATFGISTSAPAMFDKSGTTAAMLAHKLPVICVGKPWRPREIDLPATPKPIIQLREGCIDDCLKISRSEIASANVTDIAEMLIETLIINEKLS
jgi:hypothetical protein